MTNHHRVTIAVAVSLFLLSNSPVAMADDNPFHEDFEKDAEGWEVMDGKWSVKTEGDNQLYSVSGKNCGNCLSIYPQREFYDFIYTLRLRNDENTNRIACVFRHQDRGAHYQLNVGNNTGGMTLSLYAPDPVGHKSLGRHRYKYNKNKWLQLKIQCRGEHIRARIWADGEDEPDAWHIEASDDTYESGAIGLQSNDYSSASFDDIAVEVLKRKKTTGNKTTTPGEVAESPDTRIVFQDDFESDQALGWRVIYGQWKTIEENGNKVYSHPDTASSGGFSLFDEDEFEDFEMTYRLRNDSGTDRMAGVFGIQDRGSYYALFLGNNVGGLSLVKQLPTKNETLSNYSYTYSQGQWYWIRLRRSGARIQAKVWPERRKEPRRWQIDVENDTYREGKIGFMTADYNAGSFDDIIIREVIDPDANAASESEERPPAMLSFIGEQITLPFSTQSEAQPGTIHIEAEDFEGVGDSQEFLPDSRWNLATPVGMTGLAGTALEGECIYAGAFTHWSHVTDSLVARDVQFDAPGTYDIYARCVVDRFDRLFRVRVMADFNQLLEREIGQATQENTALRWVKVGSFDIRYVPTEARVELYKSEATDRSAICDAVRIVPTGTIVPSATEPDLSPVKPWPDESPVARCSPKNHALHGNAEEWKNNLPTGWTRHAVKGSPQLRRNTDEKYVTSGEASVEATISAPYTGVGMKMAVDPGTAYRIELDVALLKGKGKLQVNTMTDVAIDNYAIRDPLPGETMRRHSLTVLSGPKNTLMTILIMATDVQKGKFLVDNVTVRKIANLASARTELHAPSIDLMKLHYPNYPGKRVGNEYPDIQIQERGSDIVLRGELSAITFSGHTGSISQSILRGQTLGHGSLPNLRLVDSTGQVYLQSNARQSWLRHRSSGDGRYWQITSTVRPRTDSGKEAPFTIRYDYRIHKKIGIIFVDATFLQSSGKATKVRELTFLSSMGNSPGLGVHSLAYYSHMGPPDYPTMGLPMVKTVRTHDDATIFSNFINFATWSNGACAMQIMSHRMTGSQIHQSYLDDPTTEKLFSIKTRDGGQRCVDYVAVRQPRGDEVVVENLTKFSYAISLAPIHRLRPRIEFWSASLVGHLPPFGPSAPSEAAVRDLARMGLDYVYISYPSRGKKGPERDQYRVRNVVNLCHKYGLKALIGGVATPNNVKLFVEDGWMTPEEVSRGVIDDVMRREGHKLPTNWPNGSGAWMCMEDRKFMKTLLHRQVSDALDHFDADGGYLDIFTPLPCGNKKHGCDPCTVPLEGTIRFLDEFKELQRKNGTDGRIFIGHCGWSYEACYSRMDWTIPGEFEGGLPSMAGRDTIWTSLLYGIQVQYYTGSTTAFPIGETRFYDAILSRAAISTIYLMEGGDAYPREAQEMWKRYMMPLKIFDVERSTLRHGFDGDFEKYASVDRDFVIPMIYERPGDILLVLTKDRQRVQPLSQVTLRGEAVSLTGRIVIFDPLTRKLKRHELGENGILTLDVDLGIGPRLFRISNEPAAHSVIWHDQIVWNVSVKKEAPDKTHYRVAGVPLSRGKVFLVAESNPELVEGAEILAFRENEGLLVLGVDFPKTGKAEVIVR